MSWTEERIAALKRLWEGGATASQIADELTGVSRNAVIGKAHRLGLKARPSPVKASEKGKASAVETPPSTSQPLSGTGAGKVEIPVAAASPAVPASPAPASKLESKPAGGTAHDAPWLDDGADDAADAFLARADAGQGDGNAAISDDDGGDEQSLAVPRAPSPRIVSVGPGGFLRQGPGDQQPPIPPAPPRRLVPAKPSSEIAGKTSLLDLNDKVCRWPMGHPGEPDFHFCGQTVNPGFPYCVDHCGRAYQAQLPRGTRRPPPPLPFGGPRVR